MQPDVVATFELGGRIFEDVNPMFRSNRIGGATIPGVRPGNSDRWTMHAEFAAMLQAYDAGMRGGHGTVRITGIKVCSWCKGDIKTLARLMSLDSMTVYDADGAVIEFRNPEELQPVRSGGKAWN
jgi:hypothetical protein